MNTENQKTVKPALLAGFQDTLPAQMIPFQRVVGNIKTVFESFGFVPLETPGMERFEVLTGGKENFNKSIFVTRIVQGLEDRGTDAGQEESAMRFDLTVPLARVVAAYPELPRPFKRYQIGKVWRGEKPQDNRYREFFQFDADTIGSFSILADTEIVQLMYETLKTLGLPKFVVRVNDRRVLNGLAEILGCAERSKDLDRTVDKIGSLGVDGVIKDITTKSEKPFDPKLVLGDAEAARLREFLELRSESPEGLLELVTKFVGNDSAQALEGVNALKALIRNLRLLGIPEDFWKVDLSVARGLDYYSGPVFETGVPDMPEVGSIFSGGRFDGLVSRFIAGSNIPGVGASVGLDRLFTVLTKLEKVKAQASTAKVLVTVFDPSLADTSFLCANRIRSSGVPTEVYLGQEITLGKQLAYAARQGIRFAIIIGPDEIAAGKMALRDLDSRVQEILTEAEAIARIAVALK